MRRFIFIFMIALLPLRGWMGEAMATTMAGNKITTDNIAIQPINTSASAVLSSKLNHSDCDMHDAKQGVDANDESTPNQACSHCQACHTTGLVTTVAIMSYSPIHFAQPQVFISPYASAHIALGQKPPIL